MNKKSVTGGSKRSASATVSIQKRQGKDRGKEVVEQFSVPIDLPAGTAVVEVEYRRSETYNLGNYESRQIAVGLRVPCVPSEEGVNKAWKFAQEWVDERSEATAERLNKTDD